MSDTCNKCGLEKQQANTEHCTSAFCDPPVPPEPSEKERISDYQIDRQLTWLDNSKKPDDHDFSIIAGIIRQQRDDLADQIQLTNDWKNFFKDMRRQRDECLPWLKALTRHISAPNETLESLIQKLEAK
jgi:hypothetical protein